MKFFWIFLLILSCAEAPVTKTISTVPNFISEWKRDFGPVPSQEASALQAYLEAIEVFYQENGVENKFPQYLNTLNNNFQLIAHSEMNLPAKFKKYYGRWPVRKSPNYLRYQNEQTADLREKLEIVRQDKIRFDLGADLYEKFKNYASKIDRQGQVLKLTY